MKIKVNGKERGLHWGMGALRLYCEETGYSFEKGIEIVCGFGDTGILERTKAVCIMLLSAIRNYGNIHNEDTEDVTFFHIEAFRDETSQPEFQKIMDDFTNSMLNGKTIAETLGIVPDQTNQPKKNTKASTKKS